MKLNKIKWSQFNIEVPIEDYNKEKMLIFNTLSRNLIIIDKPLVDKLYVFIQEGRMDNSLEAEVEQLKKLGIVVDSSLDENSFMRYMINKWKYNDNMLSLFISFTRNCNFKCIYCYQGSKTKIKESFLSQSNWNKLFHFIQKRLDKHNFKGIVVALFGGEPLLNYSVLLQAVKDLRSLGQTGVSVEIDLITNGSLLTRDKSQELSHYINNVQITIDGPREIHDARRFYCSGRGSFDDILENLKNATEFFKGRIVLRSNIDENNAPYIPKLLKYLKDINIYRKLRGVDFVPTYSSQAEILANGCEIRITANIMSKIVELFKYAVKLGYKIPKRFVSGPCIAFLSNGFAIDENLSVYKCPGFLYETPDGFIDDQLNLRITNPRWYRILTFDPMCSEHCVYGPICYGGCRWMAGSSTKIDCKKKVFDSLIKDLIRIYAISHYYDKITS